MSAREDTAKISRIVIANLPENVDNEILEAKFGKYGRILGGVVQHHGLAFIQYEAEGSALTAVVKENDMMFRGLKLDVHLAKENRKEEKSRVLPPPRRRSPLRRDIPTREPFRPQFRERSPLLKRVRDFEDQPGRFPRPASEDLERKSLFQAKSDFQKPRDVGDGPKKAINICEIIVLDRDLRIYAEIVEWKLKAANLNVDLLFPREKTSTLRLLEDISKRGVLYAVVINAQNESHKSVTVNILHGTPQEHRDMPLEAAIQLISRNYEAYKSEKIASGAYGRTCPVGVPSGHLQAILRILAEGKQVSKSDLDVIIQYLTEYRSRFASDASSPPVQGSVADTINKHLEVLQQSGLQEKLMAMFGNNDTCQSPVTPNTGTLQTPLPSFYPEEPIIPRTASQSSGGGGSFWDNLEPVARRPSAERHQESLLGNGRNSNSNSSAASMLNLDNPTIQMALEDLMQSGQSILKSFDTASSGQNFLPPENPTNSSTVDTFTRDYENQYQGYERETARNLPSAPRGGLNVGRGREQVMYPRMYYN